MANDLRQLFRVLEAQGFSVDRTKSGHWLIRNRDGLAVATLAGTPSDTRSWKNSLARLKRAGLVWPPRTR